LKRAAFPAVRLSDAPVVAAQQARALAEIAADPQRARLYGLVGPLLKDARRRARDPTAAFSLTDAEVFDLLTRQEGRCAVSGLPFRTPRRGARPAIPCSR
jgi:hypothetical protein